MSLVLKRSITLDGHKTSVTLEDEFWDALRMIAYDDKTTAAAPVSQINHARNKHNLSSAIHVYVLRRFLMMGDQQKERPILSTNAAA